MKPEIKKIVIREVLWASPVVIWALLIVLDCATKTFFFYPIYLIASETGRLVHAFILILPYLIVLLIRFIIWGIKALARIK